MNSVSVVSCLLVVAAVVSANPPLAYSYLAPLAAVDSIPNPNYGFNYAVNDPLTGDNKGQWEVREGDVVRGAYSLVEPDGNIRVVEYRADPLTGFNAVVKRTGPNVHSVALPAPAPVVVAKPILAPAPIIETPIIEAPIIEHSPIIAHEPIIAPFPAIDYLPYLPLPNPAPWVHLHGSSYGPKGNIVRRWAAGPISLEGKRLTIRTKHH